MAKKLMWIVSMFLSSEYTIHVCVYAGGGGGIGKATFIGRFLVYPW